MSIDDGRERRYRLFVADEVASSMRHGLVNKISAVGALGFHLRRQLPAAETPPSALAVLPLIDAELAQATQLLDRRFLAPAAPGEPRSIGPVVADLLASFRPPAGVTLVGPSAALPALAVDPGELDLALFCLVENALEAARSQVVVTAVHGPPATLAIAVEDDGPGLDAAGRARAREPFFTTRPGRLGLGLNVVTRIAQRWRGTLELGDRPGGGLSARLLLPVAT